MNPLNYIVKTKSNKVDDKGVVTIAINAIGNLDSHGDISASGSFDKTLKENFKRTRHFLNHDQSILIGCPLEGWEENRLVLMKSELNLDVEKGKEAYSFYKLYQKNDMTLEHSVGVEKIKQDPKDERVVTEWKLWEFSTLYNWGSNPKTPLLDLKKLQFENDPQKSIKFLRDALKMKFKDETLQTYENYLTLIEKAMKKEVELVTCKCGLTFDYNSVHELTLQEQVLEIARDKINWETHKITDEALNELTPELQQEILDILANANLTKKSLTDITNFVRCPICYSRVYRNEIINPIQYKTMVNIEPPASTQTVQSRQDATLTAKNLLKILG
jgi:HK97 family phage prohead protease